MLNGTERRVKLRPSTLPIATSIVGCERPSSVWYESAYSPVGSFTR